MQVKILQSIASATFSFYPGQFVQIPKDLAEKWQITGICEILPMAETPEAKKTKK